MIVDVQIGEFKPRVDIQIAWPQTSSALVVPPTVELDLQVAPFIRGDKGPAGSGIDGGTTGQVLAKASDADNDFEWIETLHVANRLSEFDTQQAKRDARENLELQHIDGGTFF